MEKKTLQNNNKKMEMEFGVRIATHSILKELDNGCHQKNLVISPLSLHICLNLLAAGAKGQTLDQLLRFLNAENVAQLNAQSSLFMELVSASSDKTIVSMVNGIWVDQRFSFKHSFKHLADDIYRANSQSLDFKKAEQVAREINAWAKKESNGHIDNIVSSDYLQHAVLVLANALCFKGAWLDRFNPSNTEDDDFRLLNGKRVRVPFMKQQCAWSYYQSMNGFELLRMGYANSRDNKSYAMYIFLPDRHDGLLELIKKFHSNPGFFTRNHEVQYVELHKLWLPKLKYDYSLDVGENIKELGLDLPFQENAGLREIVDHENGLYVSKATQKSYIEVNEEGTIAASITEFEEEEEEAAPDPEEPSVINFVADHPFLFVVKEKISGIVLFVGAALNPLS